MGERPKFFRRDPDHVRSYQFALLISPAKYFSTL